MHHSTNRRIHALGLNTTLAAACALLWFSGTAAADSELPIDEKPKQRLSRDVIAPITEWEQRKNWFRDNIRPVKRHGFEFSRSIPFGHDGQKLIFSVRGPMVAKKTPGLSFELRF